MMGLTDLLKQAASRNIEREPLADVSSTDLDDVGMSGDPNAQFVLAMRKRRKTALLKRLLRQSGDSDMMRNITIREKE